MKMALYFKKSYRYSKRIVNRNNKKLADEIDEDITKYKFFEILNLAPVCEFYEEQEQKEQQTKNNECDINKNEAPKKKKGLAENNTNLVDKPKQSRQSSKVTCDICRKSFASKAKRDLHYESEHSPKKVYCKICGRSFENRRLLKTHKQQHSGKRPYACSKCQRAFGALHTLVAHLREHDGKLPYECKKCSDSFATYKEYNKHQTVHVLMKVDYPKMKIFKCDQCPREFRKLCDLERHMRVHTGEKPYQCLICSKSFQQAHNLTKHMIIHTQDKQFACDVCGKQFGRSDVLNRHMLIHVVDKPHHCSYCPKSFARVSQMEAHTKKHHNSIDDVPKLEYSV